MNILVTGATGFIGRHLTRRLVDEQHNVHVLTRAHSDTSVLPAEAHVMHLPQSSANVAPLLHGKHFDGIVHLATHFLSSHTPEDIPPLITANVTFGTQLLEAAAQERIPWFINTGTFAQHLSESSNVPSNLYAATKRAFEEMVTYYAHTAETTFLTLELFNTFGPDDPRKKIFTLWKSAMDSGVPLDMSPGDQIIDITYITNVIDGYCRAINLLSTHDAVVSQNSVFTLPSPERMTLRELAACFATALDKELPVNFGALPYRTGEIMEPKRGIPLPGWEARVSLHEGIRRTYVTPANN